MKTYSTYYDYDFIYRFNDSYSVNCLTSRNCQCKKVSRTKVRPGDFVGEESMFLYPHILSNYNNLVAGGVSTLYEIEDSVEIDTIAFGNVTKWFASTSITEDVNHVNWNDAVPAYFFISYQIGIIRKEIPLYNQAWNLVEYNVIF